MKIDFLFNPDEKPLDRLVSDGGFCSIFRTVGCVGDSLSSGEFESLDGNGNKGYHDMFEYSWGQFIARAAGCKVYNFSRGGMTAKEYLEGFAEKNGFWDRDMACQAYIIALGVNDLLGRKMPIGSVDDIKSDFRENADTFAGYYGAIVARLKEIQPDAKFFFVTMPFTRLGANVAELSEKLERLLCDMAEFFANSYVINLRRYAPIYDADFREKFYLGGHLSPAGYILTAQMIMSYIDYIIRHNMNDFKRVGFMGTPFDNPNYGKKLSFPIKAYANLHLHSTHSDGVFTPSELVKIAKAEGYKALALTDHDTATGYPEFEEACRKEGMECVFGVEFTSPSDLGPCFHIVGFDFDPEYPPMKQYLSDMGKREAHETEVIFRKAVSRGGITGITWEEVAEFNKGVEWLCNNHVFRAMKAKGLVKEEDYMTFFNLNYKDERAKVPPLYHFKSDREIIELINAAGGFAVLAHPDCQLKFADALIERGLKGIEVWHPDVSEIEAKDIYGYAEKHNLYISGGSDHCGLCGGYYPSCPDNLEIERFHLYCAPLSAGTTEQHFKEIKERSKG